MSILNEIMKWRVKRMACEGNCPPFVPLTKEEIVEIKSDWQPHSSSLVRSNKGRPTIAGMENFETPYAEEIRSRIVLERMPYVSEIPTEQFALQLEASQWRDFVMDRQIHGLKAMICADTTHIDVTLEWDIWARWKRWLRLTRWWPVKTRTVRIDGRVLYPYLKVSLPQNRHHVKFAINS